MAQIKFEIDQKEFEAVIGRMRKLPLRMQQRVYVAGLSEVARDIRKRAKRAAPVGRGLAVSGSGELRKRLKDSFLVKLIGWKFGGQKIKRSAAIVVNTAPHAHLLEQGTRKMRARPFLGPASENTSGMLSIFRRGVNKAFQRAIAKLAKEGR